MDTCPLPALSHGEGEGCVVAKRGKQLALANVSGLEKYGSYVLGLPD